MATIELGEVAGTDARPPGVPLDRARIARYALSVLSLLALLLAGGSARTAPPFLRVAWSAPLADGDAVSFTTDTAYVSRGVDGHVEITAYRLAGGEVLWRSTIDDFGPLSPEPRGNLVLLRVDPVSIQRPLDDGGQLTLFFYRATIALDARTGARVWRAAGEQGATGGGMVLLGEHDKNANLERLTMVDQAGRRVWSRPVPGARTWTIIESDDRPAQVVTVSEDNRLTFLRYADGSVLRSQLLPRPASEVAFVDGYLLGIDRSDQPPFDATWTVYRWGDLTPLWSTGSEDWITGCRPLLCGFNADGLVAHDPQTGAVRWHAPAKRSARSVGDDRLLLTDVLDNGETTLVNAVTGQRIGEPAPGMEVWDGGPHDSVLALRHTKNPPGLVSVTRLDLRTGRALLLGAIDPIQVITCWDLGRYLACPDTKGHLVVRDVG
ncbi:PQQ-binding-like beta-propeller repeat protein [Actinoplanes sp. TBRC 11911]|uniref:outer membrane protein assembly factor BamB family protein n=1 Tax=Actinoplanes sp. TBRC 11911 TaxID=2729386 RepID=UPI00145C5858|nr:PQQ-binding-like beta-propeller repeat protein [Actinoplanes sp. TBRC 11911]NMO56033.1 PQQ-binding-like beta-propeller repeat protein [Actinoplanes sp. TBRC 11911]